MRKVMRVSGNGLAMRLCGARYGNDGKEHALFARHAMDGDARDEVRASCASADSTRVP